MTQIAIANTVRQRRFEVNTHVITLKTELTHVGS